MSEQPPLFFSADVSDSVVCLEDQDLRTCPQHRRVFVVTKFHWVNSAGGTRGSAWPEVVCAFALLWVYLQAALVEAVGIPWAECHAQGWEGSSRNPPGTAHLIGCQQWFAEGLPPVDGEPGTGDLHPPARRMAALRTPKPCMRNPRVALGNPCEELLRPRTTAWIWGHPRRNPP